MVHEQPTFSLHTFLWCLKSIFTKEHLFICLLVPGKFKRRSGQKRNHIWEGILAKTWPLAQSKIDYWYLQETVYTMKWNVCFWKEERRKVFWKCVTKKVNSRNSHWHVVEINVRWLLHVKCLDKENHRMFLNITSFYKSFPFLSFKL